MRRIGFKEAFKVLSEIIADYELSVLTTIVLGAVEMTPVGWVATIVVAGIDATEILTANHFINKLYAT